MRLSTKVKPISNRETLALLKVLALGRQEAEAGRLKLAAEVMERLRAKRAAA